MPNLVTDLTKRLQQSEKKHGIGRSTIDLLKEKLKKAEESNKTSIELIKQLQEMKTKLDDEFIESCRQNEIKIMTIQCKDEKIGKLKQELETKNRTHHEVVKKLKAAQDFERGLTTLQTQHNDELNKHKKMLTEAVSMAKRPKIARASFYV